MDSKDIKEIKFILCSWKDEEGMHECQGWLFRVLAKATLEDDANPDRRMRRRRNLSGKDNEFGFGPV